MRLLAALATFAASCASVPPPAPVLPVPTARQMAWQERELIAFVHFGVNTFTDREWGDGTEAPSVFAPSALDARQWVAALKDGGFKMVILTAKHHDGFCLWPSRYTDHSVKASPFRGGRGDVVRELAEAARAGGLAFGVYLSPWDRHEPSYGDSPRYNRHYLSQLEELLVDYGPIGEVWFDGANGEGPNGKKQEYDFPAFWATVRRLQPGAVMFSDAGPDVRWVGNERGFASDPSWSTVFGARMRVGKPNQGQTTGHEGGSDWIPAEADVSIRPGWFYHPAEDDKVKTVAELMEIYERSVGQNAVLLLNVPPDRRGLLHEHDVARMREFRLAVEATYTHDLARGRPAVASNVRGGAPQFAATRALDAEPGTYWATDDGVRAASLEVDLGAAATFDRVLLQEPIALGQRVKSFVIEAEEGGAWKEIARGKTIGHKRIVRLPPRSARRIRVRVEDARGCPALSRLGLFRTPG
jgi:alpha-L-fucosidase